ncbi:MAG: hypothetical protein ACFFCS_21490 [Candidatus Hodarchaeota archaeon]
MGRSRHLWLTHQTAALSLVVKSPEGQGAVARAEQAFSSSSR